MFNVNESIKAQAKLCKEKGYPHFAPSSGVCWSCNKNIYSPQEKTGWNDQKYTSGITVEKAASELITGCPHCNRTYCD
ncbi:hypothetical protein KIH86_23110 [Paenibacillus sp. HN-1]|uniref:hypothetical protein n=1 Tax=Paenibacillus TaxID=44249 RepID=UPI001CA9734E|nr:MULTISPECIES: hypothetical protein [Paenibacillus]MBY9081046.1 hypothetical protein [Paenibacillus sp. CGMCC 1.18879]MBY9087083.1 hypothetical protein [Paenibacillus sinensis]